MFNLFHFANVIIGPAGINNLNTIYFLGIDATGSPPPGVPMPTYRCQRPDIYAPEAFHGLYDTNNFQIGLLSSLSSA